MSPALTSTKKVALKLLELHEQDRQWFLSNLSEDDRQKISHELQALLALGKDRALNFSSLLEDYGQQITLESTLKPRAAESLKTVLAEGIRASHD